jgi:hypothetical protein
MQLLYDFCILRMVHHCVSCCSPEEIHFRGGQSMCSLFPEGSDFATVPQCWDC